MPRIFGRQKKTSLFLILSLLILTVAVGGTIAYIVRVSTVPTNTFVPVEVDSEPVSTSSGIAVRNNGEIEAYIRTSVVINWVLLDSEGNPTDTFHSDAPIEGVDYVVAFNNSGSWERGSDGFWYHKIPVSAGGSTDVLFSGIERITTPPSGYGLSFQVITTAIQSTPARSVEYAWGVTVSGTELEVN